MEGLSCGGERKRKVIGDESVTSMSIMKRKRAFLEDDNVSTDELSRWLADAMKNADAWCHSRESALEFKRNVVRVRQIIISRLSAMN